jgi:hypothetical protein
MKRKRKGFFDEFSRIIGLIVLFYAIVILLSTPSLLLAKAITTLDTELSQASTDAMFVRAKMDFGNNEHMRAFPDKIGGWIGSDYNTTRVAESLGADVMLMRDYVNPETFQPVIFLIMQSTNRSSFHPPIVCYPALGYTIEEEGKAEIPVRDISWIEEPLYRVPAAKARYSNVTLPVKKLVVVKQSGEKVTERKVVLYFYVKDNPITSDTFTLIRVSALAPTEGSYDGFLNLTAEFMGNTIPCMFELRKEELIFFSLFASLAGKVLVGLLLLVPLPIIFYPEIKRLRKV